MEYLVKIKDRAYIQITANTVQEVVAYLYSHYYLKPDEILSITPINYV